MPLAKPSMHEKRENPLGPMLRKIFSPSDIGTLNPENRYCQRHKKKNRKNRKKQLLEKNRK